MGQAPAPAQAQAQDHELNSFENSYIRYELISCVCAVIFITMVLLDVWKAFRRKASWIPGKALGVLTIQLFLYIDHLDQNLKAIQSIHSSDQILKAIQAIQAILLVDEQLLIDSRRVMMCTFLAYLLPGMVSRDLKSVWAKVGALALSVTYHMAYEAYFVEKNYRLTEWHEWQERERYAAWLIPSYIAVSLAMILLVVLLSCAVIAGKTIRNINALKVPFALSCCNSAEDRLCNNTEDHVLKAWIVVRASQPDYIIARSVFSAFAGVVVTVCVVLLVVKWRHVPLPGNGMGKTVYGIQFAYVVVGSIVVVFRWLTAVFYFPKDVRCLEDLEDFGRSLVQQKDDLSGFLSGFLSLLLTMLLWVQKLMVSLSKVCWSLSEFAFAIIRPFIRKSSGDHTNARRKSRKSSKSDQFSKYEKVLEIIRMPGEKADMLWRANKSAFEKTEGHLEKGIENGKSSSKELILLIEHRTGTPEEEAPTSLEEEKLFKNVGKNSWKMRAVSLVHVIIYFYDGNNSDVVNDCIEAYRQALCFMDMVDRSDPEAKLVSKAADNEFSTLEKVWKKHRKMQCLENSKRNQLHKEKESSRLHNQLEEARSNNLLENKIKMPLIKNMEQLSVKEKADGKEGNRTCCVDKLHDSNDLKTVAADIGLYKIWKATDHSSNPDNAIHNLKCSLANVIFHCLEEAVLDKALRKNCNKWAEDGEETEIFNAASVAGKAKGVRQQIRQGKDKDAVGV